VTHSPRNIVALFLLAAAALIWEVVVRVQQRRRGQSRRVTALPQVRFLLWDFGDTLVDERWLWTCPATSAPSSAPSTSAAPT